jgi:hypothetical protein
MTGASSGSRGTGTTLLKIARLLCNEHLLSMVVHPTISDLQREVALAPPRSLKRLRVVWRGYFAFWTVMLVTPFASTSLQPNRASAGGFHAARARIVVGSLLIMLIVVVGLFADAWVAVVMLAGTTFAIVIHAWYVRHPSDIPTPKDRPWQSPQINFSSTKVEGNIGGLIFALGTIVIAAIGLPLVIWFLFAAIAAGSLFAWGLVAWHTSHPKHGLPQNRIVLH